MHKYASVQYLRAFAALGVVAFHSAVVGLAGQAGVDLFFVISGFIMWLVTQREILPGDFLAHRFIRIWPLYAIATLWMAAHLHASASDVLKSLTFIPFLQGTNVWPVLIPGWTLNFEMFFYVMFASVLLLPRLNQFAALTSILSGLVAIGLVLHPGGAFGRTYTSPLLLEFLAGIVIGRLTLSGKLPGAAFGALLIALGLLGLALSTFVPSPEPYRVLLWGVPGATLLVGVLSLEIGGRVPHLPWLALVGDASFSIYLFHPFMLKTFSKFTHLIPGPFSGIFLLLLITAGGVVIFKILEQNLTRMLRSRTLLTLWHPRREREGSVSLPS